MICIRYGMMTQLTRESSVLESQALWLGPFWHTGDDQDLFNFLYSMLSITFSHFSFAPDLSLISHSSTTSTPIRTLALRHCISKWNISKQICYILLHLWSTEACFFFFTIFSIHLTRGLLALKMYDTKIINLMYFVMIGKILPLKQWGTCSFRAVGHCSGHCSRAEPE